MPYTRPMTKKGNLPWYEYVYDEYYDCVLCPQNHILSYSTTTREGNREYKRKSYICKSWPSTSGCACFFSAFLSHKKPRCDLAM